MSAELRLKAKKLIELAFDRSTTEDERSSAMVQALKLIRKHGLLDNPLDGLLDTTDPTVKAAHSIFETLTDPELRNNVKKVADRFRGSRARRRRRD